MKDSCASWCYKLHMLLHKHGLEMYLGAITLFLFLKVKYIQLCTGSSNDRK